METCKNAVEELQTEHIQSKVNPILTISIGGVCCMPALESDQEAILKFADDSLYHAKKQGRNLMVIHNVK